MSRVNVKLSDSGENAGVFHDFRYTNDNNGGNSNSSMLEITNESGNEIFVEACITEQDPVTKKWVRRWVGTAGGQGLDGVRIHITGGIENSEFLQMLRLILEAEKMVEIIKP